jgi:DNA mismatch repair protein MutS
MSATLTPMMRQYRRLKEENDKDVILFFRLGDFYEMFFEDAQTASGILDIALTRRNGVPMCGVPAQAADGYLAKMIRAGKKVAICDQVEDAHASPGIVRREITRIVTPGAVLEDALLTADSHNFLAAVHECRGRYGLAFLDLSTGLFEGETLVGAAALADGLRRMDPKECLVAAQRCEEPDFGAVRAECGFDRFTRCDDWIFETGWGRETLARHFGVHSLEGLGCQDAPELIGAAAAILHYVGETLRREIAHIRSFRVRRGDEALFLDGATCLHLDLVAAPGRESAVTLFGILNTTRTAMGSRLLRDWIVRPLARREPLARRHDAVEDLFRNRAALTALRRALGEVRDLERLIARVAAGGGNARDVRAIGQSLAALPAVSETLAPLQAARVVQLNGQLDPQTELTEQIERALADEPPIALRDGGLIRPGYSPELDELRRLATEGRQWLAEYQVREQERTGIRTVKVRHNKVFGYYIEISKGQLSRVPDNYIRKQTLVNAERFVTPELKEYENKIVGAQERACQMEYDLFQTIRERVAAQSAAVQSVAGALAELDALAALADRALAAGYVRPAIDESDTLLIRNGRHPVVEQMPDAERFVPNDALLDGQGNQIIIITGPNMAGKSTYIRQVAILVVMAQMGSFVPADAMRCGLVDRIFTRIGASDDLARGRSTFMVEMQETANILHNATPRSLIVLDEIGRGTSTFDGISIAWAVAEYLHSHAEVKAKTLFATHYHELTDMALTLKGVRNYNVLVREENDQIAFLRKIVAGGSDKSYGIQVARLAGMPIEVVQRAKDILLNLEEGELSEMGQPKIARKRRPPAKTDPRQLDLFGAPAQ